MRELRERPDSARRAHPAAPASRGAAMAGAVLAVRALSSPANVLWLQRQAGNGAVSSVLSQPVVQRQPAGDACTTKLIGDDDWKVRGGDYYKDVSREILETAETEGVEFERGLFVVAQARAEQGMGDAKKNRFRVLNLTVSDAKSTDKKVSTNPDIFETASGHKYQRLSTKEFDPACANLKLPTDSTGQCTVTSSFYVYDSIGDQTRHYLEEMAKRKPGVIDLLTKKKAPGTAGIKDFSTELGKYGTNPNYAADLCANYNAVIGDMVAILDKAIQTKTDCLTEAWKKHKEAWDEFDKAHKEHAAAHSASPRDPDRIARAQEGIRRAEELVKKRVDELKWLEEAIKKLQARRAGLAKEAVCPPRKAVAPPPAP